jgi:hypothetical protein
MDGLQDGVSLLIDSVHAIRSCTYCALRETGPVTRLVMQLFAQLHAADLKLGTSIKFERSIRADPPGAFLHVHRRGLS